MTQDEYEKRLAELEAEASCIRRANHHPACGRLAGARRACRGSNYTAGLDSSARPPPRVQCRTGGEFQFP